MSEANVELARRGFEAVKRGDSEAIRAFLHPDVKWHGGDPSWEGSCQDRKQALEFMRQARARGGVGELVDVVGAGDKVVLIMRPPPEDGEEADLVANLTTFRDGQAIEMVHYSDPAAALAAAGI